MKPKHQWDENAGEHFFNYKRFKNKWFHYKRIIIIHSTNITFEMFLSLFCRSNGVKHVVYAPTLKVCIKSLIKITSKWIMGKLWECLFFSFSSFVLHWQLNWELEFPCGNWDKAWTISMIFCDLFSCDQTYVCSVCFQIIKCDLSKCLGYLWWYHCWACQ